MKTTIFWHVFLCKYILFKYQIDGVMMALKRRGRRSKTAASHLGHDNLKFSNLAFILVGATAAAGVNFINIICVHFAPIFWRQKLQSQNVIRESCA